MNEQKNLTPELEKRVQQAVDNFMQGYGCCQSVVAAFADLFGLDEKMAKRIGAGFGGGVGRTSGGSSFGGSHHGGFGGGSSRGGGAGRGRH